MAADPPLDQTSLHLARARAGDAEAIRWLVERLTPLLLTHARYRLRGGLRGAGEPEDVVQETWLVALPRLAELEPRDGRVTPVLMRFLSTTLLLQINNLARRHLRRRTAQAAPDAAGDALRTAPDRAAGVVTRVARSEAFHAVLACLDDLAPELREVVVLRLIEQRDNADVAAALGITANAASLRLRRARDAVRAALGDSVLDEL